MDSDAPLLRLRLHDQPAVARSAAAEWLPLERKDAAWLAVLAADGTTPRDSLAAWLWPGVAQKTANGSLRQRIFRLRRRLGHEVVEAAATLRLLGDVVVVSAPAAADWLTAFDYTDCPAFADWLRRRHEATHAQRRDALAEAAAGLEARGEIAAAIEHALTLVAADPLSEHARRRLMRLHYRRGDRAAAIAAFERFEVLLKDELGTRPDAETLALLVSIESADPARAPTRAPVVPASLLRPPRLVGRRAELLALEQAWAAGRVFLLLGEAGMGKTRLLESLADGRANALRVAARPGDAGVPFALLARWLRAVRERCALSLGSDSHRELARVLPELGNGPVGGEGQRLLLQRAVEALLAAAAAAGLSEMLLDDLHFADAASLEMLQALLAGDGLAALRWGLAQREGEGAAAAAALQASLAEMQRLQPVRLLPLSAAELSELVRSLGVAALDADALGPELARHTGGNPLFGLETLKDLVLGGVAGGGGGGGGGLPLPAGVGALIDRRLRTLSPQALALARVAAIAGVDFGIELAQTVLQTPAVALADAWGELEQAQVLAGGVFAHDLVFDAVRRSVPEEIARHVHGAVADCLEKGASEPGRIAGHWKQAQRWRFAAAAFERASELASGFGRKHEARGFLAEAVDAWKAAGDRAERQRCETAGVELVAIVDGTAPAIDLAERLQAEALGTVERVAAATAAALAHVFAAQWADALDHAQQAVELAAAAQTPLPALDAERVACLALAHLGRSDEAIERSQVLVGQLEGSGSLRQRREALSTLAHALHQARRVEQAARALEHSVALAEQDGDWAEVMTLRHNLAVIRAERGRVHAGLEQLRAAVSLRERIGPIGGPHAVLTDMSMGVMATAAGRFGEALQVLEATLPALRATGPIAAAVGQCHLAQLWLHLAQWHRVQPLLPQLPVEGDQGGMAQVRALVVRARLWRLARGQSAAADTPGAADAARDLETELAGFTPGRDPRQSFALKLELSRWAPLPSALALVREVRAAATAALQDGLALHALIREVDLLLGLDPGHAVELARELAARPEDLYPIDGYLPELWWVLARCAVAAGDADAAAGWQTRALAWIDGAAQDLPAGLRHRFVAHNPVNAALRALPVTRG